MMELRKLKTEEHEKTRALWEDIFIEDTKQFLDYYYSIKTRENEIYVMGNEEIAAMLHLNPYDVRIGEQIHLTHYIVAVATDKKYRRQGIMGKLLRHTMKVMHDRREPFTFLMPAAEAIYYPYDFRYVYSRKQGTVKGKNQGIELEISFAESDDCGELAEFANKMLEKYDVVTYRDAKYYRMMLKEQQSENGQIVLVRKQGRLIGTFCYAMGEGMEIREPLFYEEADFKQAVYELTKSEQQSVKCVDYGEEMQPIIMVRILHLETFLRCLKLHKPVDVYIELHDHFIKENNGIFHIVGNEADGITKVEPCMNYEGACIKMEMGTFTSVIFEKYLPKVFLNEVV